MLRADIRSLVAQRKLSGARQSLQVSDWTVCRKTHSGRSRRLTSLRNSLTGHWPVATMNGYSLWC